MSMDNYDLVDRNEYDMSGLIMTTISIAALQSPEPHQVMHLVDTAAKGCLLHVYASTLNRCLLGLIENREVPLACTTVLSFA